MSGITRDDWLKALNDIDQSEDDQRAITATEYAQMFEVGLSTAREQLTRLVRHGKAVQTTKRVKDSRGHQIRSTAYYLEKGL